MKYSVIPRLFVASLAILLSTSCSKKGSDPTPVSITSLSINSGPFNTSVTITGTGFSPTTTDDKVFFNGKEATITSANTTQLTAIVPQGAGSGNVSVSVRNGASVQGPVFTYQLSAVVTTIAGNDTRGYVDGKGSNASFYSLWGLAIDPSGNIYVSDGYYIRKITPDGTVTTLAGNSNGNSMGWDIDGKGNAATFSSAAGVATDKSGNVYIADGYKIRKMTPDGIVSTVAINNNLPTGSHDYTGIALDASDNIYLSDANADVIIKVTKDGTASILAGNGTQASIDGTVTSASFNDPIDFVMDGGGNMFVTDLVSNKIRKVTPDGTVTTIAGSGSRGATDGSALNASFYSPDGIAVDKVGNLYISDFGNNLIRKISSDRIVSTIAGTGKEGNPWVDGIGTAASFISVDCLKVDASGNIYIADGFKIRKITFQ